MASSSVVSDAKFVIAFSGHRVMPEDSLGEIRDLLWGTVDRLIEESPVDPMEVLGVTALADGADQMFADVLSEIGGRVAAVTPCDGYPATIENNAVYQTWMRRSAAEVAFPFPEPSDAAYLAAGLYGVDVADVLVVVWDGEDAAGMGGTGDVVEYAKSTGTPVEVVWPAGLVR